MIFCCDFTDDFAYTVEFGGFVQKIAGPGLDTCGSVLRLGMIRENDERRHWQALADRLENAETARSTEVQVEQNRVRLGPDDAFDRLGASFCFADDSDFAYVRQHRHQALPDRFGIVDNVDAGEWVAGLHGSH